MRARLTILVAVGCIRRLQKNASGLNHFCRPIEVFYKPAGQAHSDTRVFVDMPRHLEASERLVSAFPASPEAHALRVYARVLQAEDEPTPHAVREIEDSLQSLERLDPRMPYLDFGRADLSRIRARLREAIQIYHRLLGRTDLSPAFRAWILRLRSQCHTGTGDHERALADAQAAMDLDPANPWAFTTLSTVLSRLGRTEEALAMARRAVGLRPTRSTPSARYDRYPA